MKRFFQPVTKEGSSKKPPLSASDPSLADADGVPGAPGSDVADSEGEKREPLKFLTWNANSLLLRAKSDWPEFSKFVQDLDPDVICFQDLETKQSRQLGVTVTWEVYIILNLVEVRMPAAGSKGAPKNPSQLKDDTSSAREEKQVLMRALSSPPFKSYRVWWSLSDSKYAGTALLVKCQFQPKKVTFSLDPTSAKHEPDGRVILAEFESFRLLNTYAPNNGWKDDESSFKRRRKWDQRMLEFVLSIDKPLIWLGDLNVSHQDIDVSHPDFFINAKLNGYVPPNKEDCGQPGFTLAERQRFSTILSQYRGKRMRIDYFIISEQLKDRIVSCEIHGHGIELEGFYGSDHCPISLELSPKT